MFDFILDFILFSITNLLCLFSVFGYSSIFNNLIFKDNLFKNLLFLNFITGILFIYIIVGILFHYFSISNLLTIFIILLGIIFFIKNNYKYFNQLSFFTKYFKIVLLSVFFGLYALNNNDFEYHFFHILENKKNNLQYGLAEFGSNYKVAYNSAWLFLQSIFFIEKFHYSLFFLSSIFYSLFIRDFYQLIRKSIIEENYLSLIYFISSILFILLGFYRYKDFGTDYSSHLIMIYIVGLFLFYNNSDKLNYQFFINCLLIFSLAVISKISSIPFLLFFIFLIYKISFKDLFDQIKSQHLIMLLCPLLVWFSHNLALSGCIVYPIDHTCFTDLPWSIDSKGSYSSKHHYELISLFAKGVKISYWDFSAEELRSFNKISIWFPYWIDIYFIIILEKFLPALIILILIPISYVFNKKIKMSNNHISNSLKRIDQFFLVNISIILFIIWFLQAPSIRFGFSYILFFLLIIIVPLWYKVFFSEIGILKSIIKKILLLSLVFFISNNLVRIFYFIVSPTEWAYGWTFGWAYDGWMDPLGHMDVLKIDLFGPMDGPKMDQ